MGGISEETDYYRNSTNRLGTQKLFAVKLTRNSAMQKLGSGGWAG
jgi:hypothetical protein